MQLSFKTTSPEPHQPLRTYRRALVFCLVVAQSVASASAIAQQTTGQAEANGTTESETSNLQSRKEQLARSLQALRAAGAEQAPVAQKQPPKPAEMFLDLTDNSSPTESQTESAQAMASSLDVSMASSPTQVLMRAVAWIAIVLCLCCLVILGARRWQRDRGLLPTATSRSKVVETLSLGPGRTVSLIEMHGYRALVATDAGGIRSLVLAPLTFEESLMQDDGTASERTENLKLEI